MAFQHTYAATTKPTARGGSGSLRDATTATALFVPIAIGLSFALTHFSRKLIRKRLTSNRDKP
jgi:hypothetical protein